VETLAPERVCKNPACGKAFAPRRKGHEYCRKRCGNVAGTSRLKVVDPAKWRQQWQRSGAAYRQKHPGRCRESYRRWAARNREKLREKDRQRDAADPGKRTRQKLASRVAFRKLAFLWHLERIMAEVEAAGAKQSAGELDRVRAQVHAWDTERLKQELAQGLRVVRERLLTLAAVLAELDARGEEVTGDRHLLNLLRKIGSGELLVDAVVRFAGRPSVLASVAAMPVTEQGRVVGETDEEVEERFRTRKRAARPAPAARPHRGTAHLPTMADMGKSGTAKDVAQLCLDIIGASADPPVVAELLLPRLQELKQSRQKQGARPA
jgi:hypothetical protein